MVDFSRIRLVGELLTLDPQFQPSSVPANVQLPPPQTISVRPSGVRFDIHPVVQSGPTVNVTSPREVYDRSLHRLEFSGGGGTGNPQQNFEFNPFSTYYRNAYLQIGYFHTAWGRGRWWEGAVGGTLRGDIVWGDYHNNGSYIVGGYLCASARQSVLNLENLIGFDLSLYGCLGFVYSELNFGRNVEHRQPTPSRDFNAMLGGEAALSLFTRNRFSPAFILGYGRVMTIAQTEQLPGATPVSYNDEKFYLGIRVMFDPQPTQFPVDLDQAVLARAQAARRVAEANYMSLDHTVREGLRDQPTQADFDGQVESLNNADRALCISRNIHTLWSEGRPPRPRFRFQFFPGEYQVQTLRVQTFTQRPESVSERNAALDAIAGEMLGAPDFYFILDGYSAAGAAHINSGQDISRSRSRVQSVLNYFRRIYPRLAERLVVDDQSAHGADISGMTSSSEIDSGYYGNNVVTFTQSPVNSRTPYQCVPQHENTGAQDSHRPGRIHWELQPVSHDL